jgi:hypothetical protein
MTDTTPSIADVQISAHRRLTGVDRIKLALDMSLTVRALATARLRQAHPDWSETMLARQVMRLSFEGALLPRALRDE